jgi:hypothetical protein
VDIRDRLLAAVFLVVVMASLSLLTKVCVWRGNEGEMKWHADSDTIDDSTTKKLREAIMMFFFCAFVETHTAFSS